MSNADIYEYLENGGSVMDDIADMTMDEMISFCVKPMLEHNKGMTAEQATSMMKQFFPTLKRWKG